MRSFPLSVAPRIPLLAFSVVSVFAAAGGSAAAVPELHQSSAPARLASISISPPATIVEGDSGTTEAVFAVRLSARARKTVTVRFTTGGFGGTLGSATPGTDYKGGKGTLVFKRGQRAKQVVVLIVGDTIAEDTEAFWVKLSRARNARIRVSEATGRIRANDLPAAFTIAADLNAHDGPGKGKATITLDATKQEATFAIAISDWPHDPVSVHIHAETRFQGDYPSLQPVPRRNGTSTGTIAVSPWKIIVINANVTDVTIEVHSSAVNGPSDLVGTFHRVPSRQLTRNRPRPHSSRGDRPPISRVRNVCRQDA